MGRARGGFRSRLYAYTYFNAVRKKKTDGIWARPSRARACGMLPTPACVDLPAFLANLQHNGTPVSSKSPLPPQKHSLRGLCGRGRVAKYIHQQTPGPLFKLFLSFFPRLSLPFPLLMLYQRESSMFSSLMELLPGGWVHVTTETDIKVIVIARQLLLVKGGERGVFRGAGQALGGEAKGWIAKAVGSPGR